MNPIAEIRDEIKATYKKPTTRDLNILAALFLVLPGLIGSYVLWWKGSDSGYYWMAAGIILCLARLSTPLFVQIHRVWIGFSITLGYFVSRVLLTIIFFIVILPTGLLMRLFGKDPMDRKLDPDVPSYWVKREDAEEPSIERYEKQF
jgi:hypothetical protein